MSDEIKYVMMRRTADNDGPHPIHPAEVANYEMGGWVVVEEEQNDRELEEYKRPELLKVAEKYNVEVKVGMKNAEIASAIRKAAGYDPANFPPAKDE